MKLTGLALLSCAPLLLTSPLQAQTIYENTFLWGNFDHSAWKAMANSPDGYVIVGNKFFEPNNTDIYMTGFDELSDELWGTTHTTTQHGFSSLQTFWKSFTNIGPATSPTGFFIAAAGTLNGLSNYYTLQTDKLGQKTLDRFGSLGGGIQMGGACQAAGGGYIVVGSDNSGNIAIMKFNSTGDLLTSIALPINGFAWAVQPAPGGGYVLGSTSARATRITEALAVDWTTTVSLPLSPPYDGSAYSYSEFEEVLPLMHSGPGFVMTGSAFSNGTSANYTARLNWDGTQVWNKINDSTDTSTTGTPVAWINGPIERFSIATGLWNIVTTWRNGPVSSGGTMFYDSVDPANGDTRSSGSLLNTIPVQEAFTVRDTPFDRIVIGGTRGGYGAAYAYNSCELPGEPDLQPPVVSCPGNITQGNEPFVCGATINWTSSAIDNCDTSLSVSCNPPSGSFFPIGTTPVTCTSTDTAGNVGTCSFNVTITKKVFDIFIMDDVFETRSLHVNTSTGEYVFRCDGDVFTGTARVKVNGCKVSVNVRTPARTLSATIDRCANRGKATLKIPRSSYCQISDSNTSDDTPTCP